MIERWQASWSEARVVLRIGPDAARGPAVALASRHGHCCPAQEPYQRRTPEQTSLYRAVQESIDTFLAQAESAGARVPAFVKREFDDYLKCGILAHGFVRLRCRACGDESLIAFS